MERMPCRHEHLSATAYQKSNLSKLSKYLMSNLDTIQFDMRSYINGTHPDTFSLYVFPPFHMRMTDYENVLRLEGTLACPIGHGPAAGIPPLDPWMGWAEYADVVFGSCKGSQTWMFSKRWRAVDNTAAGAAKRIDYLLKYGTPYSFAIEKTGELSIDIHIYRKFIVNFKQVA